MVITKTGILSLGAISNEQCAMSLGNVETNFGTRGRKRKRRKRSGEEGAMVAAKEETWRNRRSGCGSGVGEVAEEEKEWWRQRRRGGSDRGGEVAAEEKERWRQRRKNGGGRRGGGGAVR